MPRVIFACGCGVCNQYVSARVCSFDFQSVGGDGWRNGGGCLEPFPQSVATSTANQAEVSHVAIFKVGLLIASTMSRV